MATKKKTTEKIILIAPGISGKRAASMIVTAAKRASKTDKTKNKTAACRHAGLSRMTLHYWTLGQVVKDQSLPKIVQALKFCGVNAILK